MCYLPGPAAWLCQVRSQGLWYPRLGILSPLCGLARYFGYSCMCIKCEKSLSWILKVLFCFSLQPCMHVFCAACYSGWMERSSLCPTCRCPVERIRKNHILNNLVEAYLIQHPGLNTSRYILIMINKHLTVCKQDLLILFYFSKMWSDIVCVDVHPSVPKRSVAVRRIWRAWTAATR